MLKYATDKEIVLATVAKEGPALEFTAQEFQADKDC